MGKRYFTTEEEQTIIAAIQKAEYNTSGEIRVHIESHCNEDVMDRAAWIFKKLKMEKTALRNGVLIYIAHKSHKFAIIGDVGINSLVKENFWEETKDKMQFLLKQNNIVEGIVLGVEEVGQLIKAFFPYKKDDINELSDEISYD